MKKIFYTAFYFCSTLLMSSCIGDLDQYPHEEETSSTIYTSAGKNLCSHGDHRTGKEW